MDHKDAVYIYVMEYYLTVMNHEINCNMHEAERYVK